MSNNDFVVYNLKQLILDLLKDLENYADMSIGEMRRYIRTKNIYLTDAHLQNILSVFECPHEDCADKEYADSTYVICNMCGEKLDI